MSTELQRERHCLSALLLLCGLCCGVLSFGIHEVSKANRVRRSQLQQLLECVARPELRSEGPIRELDGMFGNRLMRVTTPLGPAVVFARDAAGGRS